MKKFLLEMITPEREFFTGEAVSLTVETTDGLIQILAEHAPMIVSLAPGIAVIDDGIEKREAAYSQGFLSVRKDMTAVMCQTMEWPYEIEINRVERAIAEHERKMREAKSLTEYKLSKASLARAFARLKLKR